MDRRNQTNLDFSQTDKAETLRQGADAEGYQDAFTTYKEISDKNIKEIVGPNYKGEGDVNLYAKPDEYSGQRDKKTGDIYINTQHANMENGKDGLNILGHELGHGYGAKTEAEANEYGSKVVQGFERESGYQGKGGFQAAGNNLNVPKYSWQELKQNSAVIQAGNTGVEKVIFSDKSAMPVYDLNSVMKTAFAIEFHNSPDEAVKQIAKDQYNQNPVILAYRAEYVVATELSGAGDAMRIGLGLDPYTGEKLGWGERLKQAETFVFMNKLSSISNIGNVAIGNKFTKVQIKSIVTTLGYGKNSYDVAQAFQKEFKK